MRESIDESLRPSCATRPRGVNTGGVAVDNLTRRIRTGEDCHRTEIGEEMQIIGTAKCRDTKKCRLWFDQRGLDYHFVDLAKRPLSPGELRAIASGNSWDQMLDRDGKAWKSRQLEWKDFNPEEELNEEPLLLKTPVVREGSESIIGMNPEAWARISGK